MSTLSQRESGKIWISICGISGSALLWQAIVIYTSVAFNALHIFSVALPSLFQGHHSTSSVTIPFSLGSIFDIISMTSMYTTSPSVTYTDTS